MLSSIIRKQKQLLVLPLIGIGLISYYNGIIPTFVDRSISRKTQSKQSQNQSQQIVKHIIVRSNNKNRKNNKNDNSHVVDNNLIKPITKNKTTVVFFPYLEQQVISLVEFPGCANTESKQIELGKYSTV